MLVFFYVRRRGLRRKKRVGRRQSVGRGRHDAGVDAALAAAVPPVRDAAAHHSQDIDETRPARLDRAAIRRDSVRQTSTAMAIDDATQPIARVRRRAERRATTSRC